MRSWLFLMLGLVVGCQATDHEIPTHPAPASVAPRVFNRSITSYSSPPRWGWTGSSPSHGLVIRSSLGPWRGWAKLAGA